MAGRECACRECGAAFRIPENVDAFQPIEERPLGKASLEEMASELRRRGLTAVLSVIGGQNGVRRGVQHFPSEPMADDRLERLFNAWAQRARKDGSNGVAAPAATAGGPSPEPAADAAEVFGSESAEPRERSAPARAPQPVEQDFAFKGDALGMSLADFKLKHERRVVGRRRRMPWCSDETPDAATPDLLSEAWHAAAGIVHARVELPSEHNPPTIAGVPAQLLIYQFVDERLFQITAFLPTEGFTPVHAALLSRHGDPQHSSHEPRVIQWWKLNTSLELMSGRLHPPEPAVVRFYHDELLAVAGSRRPDRASDL
ncbi:MAG: hypothetical protein AAFV43_11105 [Planctomycetota bacterium]